MEGDKAMPMLDRESPLPKMSPIKIVNEEDEYIKKRSLVPSLHYADNQMSLQSERAFDECIAPMVSIQEAVIV